MTSRDRALAIIELLALHASGLPLSEIGDRLGIPRSATHRLLADLRETGYVRQDHEGGVYRLTVKLPALGLAFLGSAGITDLVQPIINHLAEKTGELVLLCVIEGDRLTRVAKAQGARSGLVYHPDEGTEVYLAATSNGHAWLSCLTNDEATELVARQGLIREGSQTGAPKTLREVMAYVERARELGYAMIEGVYVPGTSAIATPVRRPGTTTPIGTLSIAGPSLRMTKEHMEAMAKDLIAAAGQLGAAAIRSPLFKAA
jgi:DNA-binding IclR family transcriptional regulator